MPVTDQVIVRTAERSDLTAARLVAVDALTCDKDAADVVDLLWSGPATPPEVRVVAEMAGETVGVALGSLGALATPDPKRGSTALSLTRGHVNLLAVTRLSQGLGVGRALLAALERRLVTNGATRLVIRGNAPQYAWPGIDIRYTAALCLAESSGYVRTGEGLNMTVDLDRAPLDTAEDEHRLAKSGVLVRRLRPDDEPRFSDWVRTFGGTWHAEAAAALRRQPVRCHIAVRGEGPRTEFVGFACHGVNRRSWFGPMGTAESLRGQGVGAVLLRRCLDDQRAAGLHRAEIGWTGPLRFYARAVGATLDRVFWTYQKEG